MVTVGRDGADASGLAKEKRRSEVRGAVCAPSTRRDCDQVVCVVASIRQMGAHTCEQARSNVPIVRREWQTVPQPAMDITKLVSWMNLTRRVAHPARQAEVIDSVRHSSAIFSRIPPISIPLTHCLPNSLHYTASYHPYRWYILAENQHTERMPPTR
jgi:hypothetical protein